MKITWTNQTPPKLEKAEGEIITLIAKPDDNSDLITEFTQAVSNLTLQYKNDIGENRAYINDVTFYTKDINLFKDNLATLDKIYRMKMTGKLGKVSLVKDSNLKIVATAVKLPLTNDVVYNGYTSSELYDQYYTFFTAPSAPEIIKSWVSSKIDDGLVKQEITFGENDYQNSLDIVLPKDIMPNNPIPVLIHIHGGYWMYTDKSIYNAICNTYTKEGIAVVNINYPQAPDASFKEIIESCKSAIRYIYNSADKYGFDTNNITLCGHSAGAHLASVMGITNWSNVDTKLPENIFKHVILFSGIYNLKPLTKFVYNYVFQIQDSDLSDISIPHMDCCKGTPFTAYVGSKESSEFQHQSLYLKEYLEANNIDISLNVVEQHDHFSTVNDFYCSGSKIFEHCLSIIK
ncbi:alpha/beta hydrolase [Photobacterium damselae]|uniref:alpha/beta hydrolase n=1 Tax=Photobacterium damselae TaxID=38293 RepID=UPI001EDD9CF0|nr:alpha/beta hydrolase [Photobacterium damselae]MCG3815789.1 alpha/beta hydrolase [Photobacterium damselae]